MLHSFRGDSITGGNGADTPLGGPGNDFIVARGGGPACDRVERFAVDDDPLRRRPAALPA